MTKRLVIVLAPIALLAACATGPSLPAAPDYSTISPALDASAQWQAGQQVYLDWNGAQPGWSTTASGLQYKRTSEANPDGAQPGETDTVLVHYAGRLINGSEFDSSYARNEPIDFPLNRVIDGWTEGLQRMKVGDEWLLYVPPELGYGENGQGPVPPNAVLVFRVQLLDVARAAGAGEPVRG